MRFGYNLIIELKGAFLWFQWVRVCVQFARMQVYPKFRLEI